MAAARALSRAPQSQSSHGETSGDSDIYSLSTHSHRGNSLSGASTPDSEDTFTDDGLHGFASLGLGGMNMGAGVGASMGAGIAGMDAPMLGPPHVAHQRGGGGGMGMYGRAAGVAPSHAAGAASMYRQPHGPSLTQQMNLQNLQLAGQMANLGIAGQAMGPMGNLSQGHNKGGPNMRGYGHEGYATGYRVPSMSGGVSLQQMQQLQLQQQLLLQQQQQQQQAMGMGMGGMPPNGTNHRDSGYGDMGGGLGGSGLDSYGQEVVFSSLGLGSGLGLDDGLGMPLPMQSHLNHGHGPASKPLVRAAGPFYSDTAMRQQQLQQQLALQSSPQGLHQQLQLQQQHQQLQQQQLLQQQQQAAREGQSQSPLSFLQQQGVLSGLSGPGGRDGLDAGAGVGAGTESSVGPEDSRLSLSSAASSSSAGSSNSSTLVMQSRSRGNSLTEAVQALLGGTCGTPPLDPKSMVPMSPKSFRHKSQLPIACPTPLRARSLSDSNSLAFEMAESVLDGLGTPTSSPGTPRHLLPKGMLAVAVTDGAAPIATRRRTGSTDSDLSLTSLGSRSGAGMSAAGVAADRGEAASLKRMNSKDSMNSLLSASSDPETSVSPSPGHGGKRG